MRFLLLIPAIFLFLSNIPFIQERDVKVMRGSSNGDCWMKNISMEKDCQKPPINRGSSKEEHCPRTQTETTCICIWCFQFSAQDQALVSFDNSESSIQKTYTSLLDQRWIDPFLSAPWQPPDFA